MLDRRQTDDPFISSRFPGNSRRYRSQLYDVTLQRQNWGFKEFDTIDLYF